MKYLRSFSLTLIFLLLISCSTVPLTGRKQVTLIPSSQIISLSQDSYKQVLSENKISANTQYVNSVKQVGKNITDAVTRYMAEKNLSSKLEGYSWEYNVIVSDELNAWCMPGGKIAFYEGIMPMCQDDNGIAVVMAHEIAHAIADHGNERMTQQLAVQVGGLALAEALQKEPEKTRNLALLAFGVGSQVGFLLPYSRTHETEADELGLYFMAMAGYNPQTAPAFWERMQAKSQGSPPEFLSTHPNPGERIKHLQSIMPKAMEYYNKGR
ncbi:MAG: M48 family metallopeptidase [Bacteroidales bacterium]|nr:M48 family metallopeptidase [Bacteroidales bacterium]